MRVLSSCLIYLIIGDSKELAKYVYEKMVKRHSGLWTPQEQLQIPQVAYPNIQAMNRAELQPEQHSLREQVAEVSRCFGSMKMITTVSQVCIN